VPTVGVPLVELADRSILAGGALPASSIYDITAAAPAAAWGARAS
jgi:hypothetical protein